MKRLALIFLGLLVSLVACEGPEGPEGPQGPQGPALQVQAIEGTILNRNYTEGNPSHASIPLSPSGDEPTVLFFGTENDNGVYNSHSLVSSAVIWGGQNSKWAVPSTSGWYLLVYNRNKDLVGENYQVKFIQ